MDSDNGIDVAVDGDPAAQAFARLEGQVALMRRAVEQLAAERADIVIPDYGATLGDMAVRLGAIGEVLGAMAESPAMRLTPESLAERIERAAEAARRSDREQLAEARRQFDRGVEAMRGLASQARRAAEQHRQLVWAGCGGLVAGILLWSFLPGTLVRSVPASWHWPERLATRMLGEASQWEAGARMMQTDSPEAWQALTDAAGLLGDNKQAIADCRRTADRAAKSVHCSVEVEP